MFFVQTLSPPLTDAAAAAIYEHLRAKRPKGSVISPAELDHAVREFLASRAGSPSPDIAIAHLIRLGHIRRHIDGCLLAA